MARRTIKAKELATDIKDGMTYEAIKAKFQLSDHDILRFIAQLLQKRLINEKDIENMMGRTRGSDNNSAEQGSYTYDILGASIVRTVRDLLKTRDMQIALVISALICWIWIAPNSWFWWFVLTPLAALSMVGLSHGIRKWESSVRGNWKLFGKLSIGSLCLIAFALVLVIKMPELVISVGEFIEYGGVGSWVSLAVIICLGLAAWHYTRKSLSRRPIFTRWLKLVPVLLLGVVLWSAMKGPSNNDHTGRKQYIDDKMMGVLESKCLEQCKRAYENKDPHKSSSDQWDCEEKCRARYR